MRNIVTALAFAVAFTGAALAQESQPPPSAESTPQVNPRVLAIQDVYTALFFDTGLYERSISTRLPELRETAVNSAFYRMATPRHRQALDAVIDSMPTMMREEVVTEISLMANDIAPRLDPTMNTGDVQAFANFLRDPQWHDMIQRIIEHAMAKDSTRDIEYTSDERERFEAFAQTAQGRSIARNAGPFFAVLTQELDVASPRIQTRVQQRLQHDVCAALESQCPRSLRDAAGGI